MKKKQTVDITKCTDAWSKRHNMNSVWCSHNVFRQMREKGKKKKRKEKKGGGGGGGGGLGGWRLREWVSHIQCGLHTDTYQQGILVDIVFSFHVTAIHYQPYVDHSGSRPLYTYSYSKSLCEAWGLVATINCDTVVSSVPCTSSGHWSKAPFLSAERN